MKNRKLEKTPITIILSLMILFGVFTATSNNAYAQSKDINEYAFLFAFSFFLFIHHKSDASHSAC